MSSLSAGNNFTVALARNGTVFAWGSDAQGQLGNGTAGNQSSTIPVLVSGLTDVVAISASGTHATAQKSNTYTYTDADGDHVFRIGDLKPEQIAHTYQCVTNIGTDENGQPITDQEQACKKEHTYYDASPVFTTVTGSYKVADGSTKTVTFDRGNDATWNNELYVWGNNTNWELGIGTNQHGVDKVEGYILADYNRPVQEDGTRLVYETYFDNFAYTTFQVAAGRNHTAVLGEDGYVYSFGKGTLGTLGDGRAISSETPLRTGIREESVVVEYSGKDFESSSATLANTINDRHVVDQDNPYRLSVMNLRLKEYNGFNVFYPGSSMKYLNGNTPGQNASARARPR